MAGFGSLTATQRINVVVTLNGMPVFTSEMNQGAASMERFGAASATAGKEMEGASEKAFLMRQGLFTMRRFLFYGTMAALGMGAAVFKMGLDFNNTMQTAQVGFTSMMHSSAAAQQELKQLYILAALTPFQFPDIVMATRRIFAFSQNIHQTNLLVTGLTNALSRAGLVSAQYLNRAALALGHMFAQGKLTGRVLYQMAQDNIPLQQALQKQMHATGETIRNDVAAGMISANQAASALIALTQSSGYKNAAKMQATRTLVGAWSTFKDFLRMASSTAQGGLFGTLQKDLRAIDLLLEPIAAGKKPLTLTNIAQAIDQVVSPKTHLIINLFMFFQGVVEGVTGSLYLLLKAFNSVFGWLNGIIPIFGKNAQAAKLFGIVLGILITRLILVSVWTAIATAAEVLYNVTGLKFIWTNKQMAKSLDLVIWSLWNATATMIQFRIEAWLAEGEMGGLRMAIRYVIRTFQEEGFVAAFQAGKIVLMEFAAAAWEVIAAWAAALWPVAVILAVGYVLFVLYMRWKAFRDVVKETVQWIKQHWALLVDIFVLPGLGTALKIMIDHWNTFKNVLEDVYNWIVKIINKFLEPLKGPAMAVWHFVGKVAHYASYALPPGMGGPSWDTSSGGATTGAVGRSVVTHHRPQLVGVPGGLTSAPPVQSLGLMNTPTGDNKPIVVQLVVDRKILAQQVARANQDYASRR